MKSGFRNKALACAVFCALSIPAVSHATNGMFMIGYGAKGTSMGGAGTAYPQDAMAAAYNPASMNAIGHVRIDATLELFHPPRAVHHDSSTLPTDARSKNDLFPIPAIGAVMADSEEDLAFGFAMIGAGLGTSYDQEDGTFFDPAGGNTAYKKVGVFLMQMQMLPSASYKINENNSVGASLVIAMQTFRAYGLETFVDLGFSSSADGLTNKNSDWSTGFGARLGWFGQFFDKSLNLGVMYAPRVNMQKFNRYTGLFANHGEFDIPENYSVGMAYRFTPSLAMAFDVSRIMWHDVASIGNPGPNAADPADLNPLCPGADTPDCQLGGDQGMGFGWRNQTVYKLGFDYRWDKDLSLRAGVNYGKSPIPEDQVLFNMLAPATTEKHVTFGATFVPKKGSDITLTYMHALKNTIKGPTAFPPPPGIPVEGSNAAISMQQTSISIAYGTKF